MKNNLLIILAAFVLLGSCRCSKEKNEITTIPVVKITATEEAWIYLDGIYTGFKAPKDLVVSSGEHTIGVALEQSNKYLSQTIQVDDEDIELNFGNQEAAAPKVWKALWIGIKEAQGVVDGKTVSTHLTTEELNTAHDFYQWSLRNHFEKFSYGTMKWESERIDIKEPVSLNYTGNGWYVLEPETIYSLFPEIKNGDYDCIFTFWREQEGTVSFKSSYFGLGWTDPMNEAKKIGYVTVKFDVKDDINSAINWYITNDPGVWVHEWLHTVGENFFQDKGLRLPQKGGDGLVVHGAEVHHYKYPWMDWYKDFISGRVKDTTDGSTVWVGIGPDALLKYNVRESALQN